MKKLIVSLTLAAFAVAAHADDAKAPTKETKATKEKETAGCCSAAAKATTQAKTACAESAKAKTADCGSCCSNETPVKRTALLSPKAAAERGL
jgi:hypothetical protein